MPHICEDTLTHKIVGLYDRRC